MVIGGEELFTRSLGRIPELQHLCFALRCQSKCFALECKMSKLPLIEHLQTRVQMSCRYTFYAGILIYLA